MSVFQCIGIPDSLLERQEAEQEHEKFVAVFQAGDHFRMDRMGRKQKGDQEWEEVVVISQQTPQHQV